MNDMRGKNFMKDVILRNISVGALSVPPGERSHKFAILYTSIVY